LSRGRLVDVAILISLYRHSIDCLQKLKCLPWSEGAIKDVPKIYKSLDCAKFRIVEHCLERQDISVDVRQYSYFHIFSLKNADALLYWARIVVHATVPPNYDDFQASLSIPLYVEPTVSNSTTKSAKGFQTGPPALLQLPCMDHFPKAPYCEDFQATIGVPRYDGSPGESTAERLPAGPTAGRRLLPNVPQGTGRAVHPVGEDFQTAIGISRYRRGKMLFSRRENSSRTRRRLAMAGVPMTPPPRDAQPDQTPPVHCQMCHKELGVLSEAPALAKTSRPPKGFL